MPHRARCFCERDGVADGDDVTNHPNRVDHPRLRAGIVCVLCTHAKEKGPLVCWRCYRKHDLRNGNPAIERVLDHAEANH